MSVIYPSKIAVCINVAFQSFHPLCSSTAHEYWSDHSKECFNCGLVYITERIAEHDLPRFYKGYNDERAVDERLQLQRDIMYRKDLKFIEKLQPNFSSVLDIGCGNCEFLKIFEAYEIWKYYDIEGGVIFVFGDELGFGDFRILHSTKRGEVHQVNWLETLRGN